MRGPPIFNPPPRCRAAFDTCRRRPYPSGMPTKTPSMAAALSLALVLAAPLRAQEPSGATPAATAAAPKVFLDRSPKIVAFQLKRLTNAQLLAVERTTNDPKYVPVYDAILVRTDVERKFRQEAADALAALNRSDPVVEILNGI